MPQHTPRERNRSKRNTAVAVAMRRRSRRRLTNPVVRIDPIQRALNRRKVLTNPGFISGPVVRLK